MLHAVRHTGIGAVFHHAASDGSQLECLTRLRFDEVDVLVRDGDEAGHIAGVDMVWRCASALVLLLFGSGKSPFRRLWNSCDRSDCKVEKDVVLGL